VNFSQSISNDDLCSAKKSIGVPYGVTNLIFAFFTVLLAVGFSTNKNSRDSIEPSSLSGISITISLTR
jgi:hypothetical protein